MTYWRYWQFSGAPFSGDANQPLFRGATVEEALARIEFLASNRRNLGLLMGKSGVGKTSILRHIAQNPPASEDVPNVRCIRTSMLGLMSGELLQSLAVSLTGSRLWSSALSATPGAAWNCLCDYFNASRREDMQTLLLLDDAESSSAEGERDLGRLLSMTFPLTIIMAVEAESIRAMSSLLLDRTELQIELHGWDQSQTAEFLNWSCAGVGVTQQVFTDDAIERIQQLSAGLPRRIIQIADLALVAGAVAQADCINGECIDQVALELPRSSAA